MTGLVGNPLIIEPRSGHEEIAGAGLVVMMMMIRDHVNSCIEIKMIRAWDRHLCSLHLALDQKDVVCEQSRVALDTRKLFVRKGTRCNPTVLDWK